MIRRIVPPLAGIVTGIVLIYAGEAFIHSSFPPPQDLDIHNKAQVLEYMNKLPSTVFVMMILCYGISSFLAGIAATAAARQYYKEDVPGTPIRPAIITAVVLTLAGLINAIILPHPTWFVVANAIIYLPAAFVGYTLVRKR